MSNKLQQQTKRLEQLISGAKIKGLTIVKIFPHDNQKDNRFVMVEFDTQKCTLYFRWIHSDYYLVNSMLDLKEVNDVSLLCELSRNIK